MTLTRRRFLTLSAACAALPGTTSAASWQGHAFGADVSLTIHGPGALAAAALKDAHRLIRAVEAQFSIYDPASALSGLNRTGRLIRPSAWFSTLMTAADRAYHQTAGLFDPTIQPVWTAHAEGQNPASALAAVGWERVQFSPEHISLGAGQALTFNGIAQGFATDLISDALTARGLRDVLVNIGEHRGTGGPWKLALQDPEHGVLGMRTLTTGAIATSSPAATPLGRTGHILHPTARPRWSTVAVEAPSATVADALSTAMVLATRDQIKAIAAQADVARVTMVDFDGNLSSLS